MTTPSIVGNSVASVWAKRAIWLPSAFLLLLVSTSAGAKDLSQRLGIGFDLTANNESPVSGNQGVGAGFSARYWIDSTWAVQGVAGFNVSSIDALEVDGVQATQDLDVFAVSFEGRLLGKLVDETNMHLYAGGEFGISYASLDSGSESADQVVGSFGALAGAEFFLQGLPNLSFSTEIGFGLNVGSDPDFVSVGTSGNLFGGIAIHYYFGAMPSRAPEAADSEPAASVAPPRTTPPPPPPRTAPASPAAPASPPKSWEIE